MARFLVAFALTAVVCCAAPKERAWQNGKLLSNYDTRFFSKAEINGYVSKDTKQQYGDVDYLVSAPGNNTAAVFETFMFESAEYAYLAQVARLKTSRPIHLSQVSPVKLAVDKNKLWFVDQDGAEYEAKILKQVQKLNATTQPATVVAQQEAPKPAVAAQPEPKPAPVAVVKPVPAPAPKPEPVVVAKEVRKPEPVAVRPAPAPAPKPEPVVVAKEVQKPEPVAVRPAPAPAPAPVPVAVVTPKPVVEAVAPRPMKDRAWQSGQLLSTAANQYFVNISYSTDSDGSTWNMVQGSDGRYSLAVPPKAYPTNSTYDNYVIESQFCAYLVQRWRPKTSPAARFPGATTLKFAVDKSKLYVLDEEGKEYETKIIKLVQRDTIDTHTHIVSR